MTISVIYMTYPSRRAANAAIDELLQKRLIACATCLQAGSKYHWKGKIVSAKEWIVLAKTTRTKKALAFVRKVHPYDIPCILSWNVSANADFSRWVESSCR